MRRPPSEALSDSSTNRADCAEAVGTSCGGRRHHARTASAPCAEAVRIVCGARRHDMRSVSAQYAKPESTAPRP
ncbi:MAG: hypothetical protein K2K03_10240 [Prevotella sp.]|nr:hypothetical protein [Prevotella sp.]